MRMRELGIQFWHISHLKANSRKCLENKKERDAYISLNIRPFSEQLDWVPLITKAQ